MGVEYRSVDDPDDVGQRIDNFLLRILKGVPKSKIYRVLRTGQVRVNGGRVKPTYKLDQGDQVRIPPITVRQSAPIAFQDATATQIEASILYEDQRFIGLNKPAGFAVHGGSSISAGIIEILRIVRDDPRLELAHRLDKDTSGCLLICKKRSVLAAAQAAFRERKVKKHYHLIVHGSWPKQAKTVQLRLKRYSTEWGERRVRVDGLGQTARTDFEILASKERATQLRASLHTGRTHQIRVHAQSQGCPLVGDSKYGVKDDQAARLCLHAERLIVPTQYGGLELNAPLDKRMEQIWSELS